MSIVYIPHMPTRFDRSAGTRVPSFDTEQAARFGELRVITWGHEGRLESSRLVKEAMKGFTSDDFILLIGDVVLLSIALSTAMERSKSVSLLRWDNSTGAYRKENLSEWLSI